MKRLYRAEFRPHARDQVEERPLSKDTDYCYTARVPVEEFLRARKLIGREYWKQVVLDGGDTKSYLSNQAFLGVQYSKYGPEDDVLFFDLSRIVLASESIDSLRRMTRDVLHLPFRREKTRRS